MRSVLHVLLLSSQPQVSWINAGSIVASGAIMQNEQPVSDRPFMNRPGKLVGRNHFSVGVKLPVTMMVQGSSPKPARSCLNDLFPKMVSGVFEALYGAVVRFCASGMGLAELVNSTANVTFQFDHLKFFLSDVQRAAQRKLPVLITFGAWHD